MATRSTIAVWAEEGIHSIYCHWDGYPEGVGLVLKENYTDIEKINELIELGDLSSLGPEIGERHLFDSDPGDWCKAYGRDRGETLFVEAKFHDGLHEWIDYHKDSVCSYGYLWNGNEWVIFNFKEYR
jgi:hypothetical protein